MNQILFNIVKKQAILIIIFILLTIIIWFRGPTLVLNGLYPFYTIEQRCYAILLMGLLWFLKLIFVDLHPNNRAQKNPPEIQKKVERLIGHFKGAIEFLKKTTIQKQDKKINLLSLPWFLFIGPENSGKTTLLANSNIHFILAKPNKSSSKKISPSDISDWYVTKDAVIVDTPGGYLLSQTKNGTYKSTLFHRLWRELIFLIVKHRKKHLKGVIIALHFPEIIRSSRQHKNQLVFDLRKRLLELHDTFGKHLPIHILITKCDLIPGFIEFFSESTTEEIAQTFGITLSPLMSNEHVHEVFTERFNALIKRLNKHLITRLHQERNLVSRARIKDFPLHIEHLKENIAEFIKALGQSKLPLRSVHLTSAAQTKETVPTTIITDDNSTQSLSILTAPPRQERTYFIKQFLLQTLLATSVSHHPKNYHQKLWTRRIAYAASITFIVAAATIFGRDFKQGMDASLVIQNHLAEYEAKLKQTQQSTFLTTESLTLLDTLQKAAENKSHLLFYANHSADKSRQLYQETLQTIVLPQIKNYFERYLQTATQKKAENVYPVLKAYIMLGDKKHFEANFIAKTLTQLMPAPVDPQTILALTEHVKGAVQSESYFKLDPDLIWKVRKEFYRLPKLDLAFILLKNMDDNNVDQPIAQSLHLSGSPILMSKALELQIPAMYTAKSFEKIISRQINQAIDEIYEGNWILGNNPYEPTDEEVVALTTDVHTQYIEKYVDIWESLLANIEIRTPKNLNEMDAIISALTSHQSPLLQLLHTIRDNTNFIPVLDSSPKLHRLGVLVTDVNNNGLYDIFVSLQQLHHELQLMLQASNPSFAIFQATVKRTQSIADNDSLIHLRTIAENAPEPLKSWLLMIAKNTWQQMLLETSKFIEEKYQHDLMSTYRSQIMNHYPFHATSLLEVDLTQFTNFFGNPGQLGQFHQQYLKPFLDESGKAWRVVDNQKIPLNEAILEQIDQGMHLQHTFFPNGDNKLYVTFSLQPMSLDKNMRGLTLNINGQELRYEKNHEDTPRLLSWPGVNSLHATTLNFVSMNNQLLSKSYHGNWGWFKLVSASTETVRSKKELVLSFNVDGYSAKYVLYTEGKLNPFLPMNISHFALIPHVAV